MRSDWLAAASFERMHETISAINMLSIHAKLLLAGVDDPTGEGELEGARSRLQTFVNQLQSMLDEVEEEGQGYVTGADPRLSELGLRFLSQRQRKPPSSQLYSVSLERLNSLIASENQDDLNELILYLRELRRLVEEYSHADVSDILGDV